MRHAAIESSDACAPAVMRHRGGDRMLAASGRAATDMDVGLGSEMACA